MQAVYDIAGDARREMARTFAELRGILNRRELILWRGVMRMPTAELISEIYWARVREILRNAHVEINPDSPIAIQCANCKRVDMVKRDVRTFHCHCSPSEEQWVHKSRSVDLIP